MIQKDSNISEQIIQLVETKSFDQLSDTEKNLVMEQLTEVEYNELHVASMLSLSYFNEGISPSPAIQKNLSKAFKEKKHSKTSILTYRIEVWKAAAIVISLIWIGLWGMNQRIVPLQSSAMMIRDTVIVQQKLREVQRIVDTVILYRQIVSARLKNHSVNQSVVSNSTKDTSTYITDQELNIGIRTFQPEDLEKELPNNNGKTMHEDELLRHFSFARI